MCESRRVRGDSARTSVRTDFWEAGMATFAGAMAAFLGSFGVDRQVSRSLASIFLSVPLGGR